MPRHSSQGAACSPLFCDNGTEKGGKEADCFCVFGPSSGVDRRRRRLSLIALSPRRPTWFSQQIGEGGEGRQGACEGIGLPACLLMLGHCVGGGGVTNFSPMFTQSSIRPCEEGGGDGKNMPTHHVNETHFREGRVVQRPLSLPANVRSK